MVSHQTYIPVITVDSEQDTARARTIGWLFIAAAGLIFGISVVFAQLMDVWTPIVIGSSVAIVLVFAGLGTMLHVLTFGIRTQAEIARSGMANAHELAVIQANADADVRRTEAERDNAYAMAELERVRIVAPDDKLGTRMLGGSDKGKPWPWQKALPATPYLARTITTAAGEAVPLALVDAIVSVWRRDENADRVDPFNNAKPYSRARVREWMRAELGVQGNAFENADYGRAEAALMAYRPANANEARYALTKLKHGIAPPQALAEAAPVANAESAQAAE